MDDGKDTYNTLDSMKALWANLDAPAENMLTTSAFILVHICVVSKYLLNIGLMSHSVRAMNLMAHHERTFSQAAH